MELTSIQEDKLRKVKQIAQSNLELWKSRRAETLLDLENEPILEVVEQMFQTADELTDIIMRTIDIDHHLAPQIIAVLSAMVLGITKGNGIDEVENLMKLHNGSTELH